MHAVDRRTAIKWMLTAYGALSFGPHLLHAAPVTYTGRAIGYGRDADLTRHYDPGDLWPLTLTAEQKAIVTALCDVIIPADDHSPSASAVGVPAFIDEWVSGPYEMNRHDRPLLLDGVTWIDDEARRRFHRGFAACSDSEHTAICDDICDIARAKPEYQPAARFFTRFRDLVSGGFYTTPEGMKDVGYIGNVPLAKFDGPPPELLEKLGLT